MSITFCCKMIIPILLRVGIKKCKKVEECGVIESICFYHLKHLNNNLIIRSIRIRKTSPFDS